MRTQEVALQTTSSGADQGGHAPDQSHGRVSSCVHGGRGARWRLVPFSRVDATVTECASPYSTPGLAETGRQVPILPSVPRSQEGRARRHVRFAFFLGLSAVSPVSQLIEIGFSRLMPRMTMARTIKLYKLPDTPQVCSLSRRTLVRSEHASIKPFPTAGWHSRDARRGRSVGARVAPQIPGTVNEAPLQCGAQLGANSRSPRAA